MWYKAESACRVKRVGYGKAERRKVNANGGMGRLDGSSRSKSGD